MPDGGSAFLRAEADYLDEPDDCPCDAGILCPCRDEEFEPDFEVLAEERAERMEARYEP